MPKTPLKPEKKAHEKKETPKQEPAAKQTPQQTKKGRRKPAQPSHHSSEEVETKELEELPPLQYSLSDKYSTDNISTDGLTRTAEDVKESKERRDEEMKRVATMRSFWKSKPAEFRDRVRNWQQRELKKRPPNEVMEEGKAKFNLTDEQYSWLLFHPSGANVAMRAAVADPEPPATAEHCFLWRVNRHSFIDPELFLRSSAQTLLVMCFTAFFLSGPPHNEDLLAKILGYHGFLCTVSYSPALYVTPLMFGVFFFFSLRFVLTDIARIQQEYVEKNTLGALVYGLCYISDVIYGLAACAFVLVFVIPVTPSTLWQHCLPLLALVLARWMAMFSYMIRFVQPSSGQWFVFMINTVVSFGYVACVTLDLLHPPQAGGEAYISPNITMFFDYAWFGMLFVVYRALPRQPRLETTVGLESFEPPTGVSTATTTEEIPGEPKSIVGKWIDEGETPPFDCAGHNHIWNWEYLNTWTGFRAKMFFLRYHYRIS